MSSKIMQQSPQIFAPPAEITTEQIQKCLDENKQLIMAILENQNLGKSAECALYQTQLQQNLMYLARIADAQPQAPKMPSQMSPSPSPSPHSSMPRENYTLPSQPTTTQQQQGFMASKGPLPLHDQQQQQQHPRVYVQQQQLIAGQMGMRPTSTTSSIYQTMQTGHDNNLDCLEPGN
ncbi:GRF1-interacting factor like [Melia azedarach]|uniref:GRF1-interacting factor like n=1 Tax=Melia azedarach TaxID=155640 RepID=A0ACC1YT85_MELAZ|nr:GRF1-interacting factor like [Melia azedarach]